MVGAKPDADWWRGVVPIGVVYPFGMCGSKERQHIGAVSRERIKCEVLRSR